MLSKASTSKKPMEPSGNTTFADTTSRAYNAELVRLLSLAMRKKIAGCAAPLGYPVSIHRTESAVENPLRRHSDWKMRCD
jgi:hypothetical protein